MAARSQRQSSSKIQNLGWVAHLNLFHFSQLSYHSEYEASAKKKKMASLCVYKLLLLFTSHIICVGGEVREASSLKFIKIGQNPGLQPLPPPLPPHTWSCQSVATDWKKLPHLMYFLLLLFLLPSNHYPVFSSSSSLMFFLLFSYASSSSLFFLLLLNLPTSPFLLHLLLLPSTHSCSSSLFS
jgi:hypothetical protein